MSFPKGATDPNIVERKSALSRTLFPQLFAQLDAQLSDDPLSLLNTQRDNTRTTGPVDTTAIAQPIRQCNLMISRCPSHPKDHGESFDDTSHGQRRIIKRFRFPACRVSHDRQIACAILFFAFSRDANRITPHATTAPSCTSLCDRPEHRRTEIGGGTNVVPTVARAIGRTIAGRPGGVGEHPTRQHRMG